jgi:hypothetical protein
VAAKFADHGFILRLNHPLRAIFIVGSGDGTADNLMVGCSRGRLTTTIDMRERSVNRRALR